MSVVFESDIPAPPGTVFAHLTDPGLLTRWWSSGAETSPMPGGTYHLWWGEPGWSLRGSYETVEAPISLTFTWEWDHDDTPARRVDVAIEPNAGGSHLTIRHESESAEEGARYLEGWEQFIGRLDDLLRDGA